MQALRQFHRIPQDGGCITLLRIKHPKIQDAAVIQEFGDELEAVITQLPDADRRIAIDFHGVTMLGSAALNRLIQAHRKMKSLGGLMILCGMRDELYDVFVVTRLVDSVFTIVRTTDDALTALRQRLPEPTHS